MRLSSDRSKSHGELCNKDVRTLIGLGDESASIVDRYGQLLRSRNSAVRLRFAEGVQAFDDSTTVQQSLLDGYLPIIESRLGSAGRAIVWNAFSSDHGGIKADYVEVVKTNSSFELDLLFPRSTSIRVEGGWVCDDTSKVLAVFTKPSNYAVRRAKYNNELDQIIDPEMCLPGQPVVREFRVVADSNELRIKAAVDASTIGSARLAYLSAIWVFSSPVDVSRVISGSLNGSAQYYVRCGQEVADDIASSVKLVYEDKAAPSVCIWLPYDLELADTAKLAHTSLDSARESEKARWNRLLEGGAELLAGNRRLDDLYRTSLINLLLLRTRFPAASRDGEDIFVVKPGADWYDTFWTRDGAYICTTLDRAGLAAEAEESLRLFWKPHLTGTLNAWGQQPSGGWAAPATEWDAQGQALWALVSHYEFTRDTQWLNAVYDSLIKGVQWIQWATNQSKVVNEDGEKPIYYGLLPMGSGEAIADGYNYYHCYWSSLGLKQVKLAAQALRRTSDLRWVSELYEDFSANLLASIN